MARHRKPMLILLALLLTALPAALSAQAPPGPTMVYQTSMEVGEAPETYDLIHLVLDFAPGAATPLHYHGGDGIVTVLEGELTHRPEGAEEVVVRAGESFEEIRGRPHTATNTGDGPARAVFAVMLPPGADLTTPVGEADPAVPPPQIVSRTQITAVEPPATFELINLVLDFAPGAVTPLHHHGGQGIVTVLEGEVVHQPVGMEELVVATGEHFEEPPGRPHTAGNEGDETARVVFSLMLPPGAEVTTVLDESAAEAPATLPSTGAAAPDGPVVWLLAGAAMVALAGGWLLRRGRAR